MYSFSIYSQLPAALEAFKKEYPDYDIDEQKARIILNWQYRILHKASTKPAVPIYMIPQVGSWIVRPDYLQRILKKLIEWMRWCKAYKRDDLLEKTREMFQYYWILYKKTKYSQDSVLTKKNSKKNIYKKEMKLLHALSESHEEFEIEFNKKTNKVLSEVNASQNREMMKTDVIYKTKEKVRRPKSANAENAIEKMYQKYKNIDYYNLYDINDKNKVRKKLKNKQEHEEAR